MTRFVSLASYTLNIVFAAKIFQFILVPFVKCEVDHSQICALYHSIWLWVLLVFFFILLFLRLFLFLCVTDEATFYFFSENVLLGVVWWCFLGV